jgi:hypothetical protein
MPLASHILAMNIDRPDAVDGVQSKPVTRWHVPRTKTAVRTPPQVSMQLAATSGNKKLGIMVQHGDALTAYLQHGEAESTGCRQSGI